MTTWPDIAATMLRRWPDVDWAKWEATGALDQLAADLADLDLEQAAAALDVLGREPRRFPPLAGEIRQKVIELTVNAPPWSDVKQMVTPSDLAQPLGRQRTECPQDRCDGSGWLIDDDKNEASACPCRAARIRSAKVRSELVQEFVAEVGRAEFRGLASDRTVEAQARVKYEAYVAKKYAEQRHQGLPDAGLAGLKQAEPELLEAAL